jgi:indolepyruvate ferredoxin oxidoreductase beta subunit
MARDNNDRGREDGFRILIAGTGGQGVLTAARLLTDFFVREGRSVTSGQLHGMAQRGGSVQSSIMVDCGMNPVIPKGRADWVLGLEPVETARALPFVSPQTTVFMNTAPVIPFTLDQQAVRSKSEVHYPAVDEMAALIKTVTPHVHTLDATGLALEAGSIKALNVVMLGCWFGSDLCPFSPEDFMDTVMKTAPVGWRQVNSKAFLSGVELVRQLAVHEQESGRRKETVAAHKRKSGRQRKK